jgi:hypothetical protein
VTMPNPTSLRAYDDCLEAMNAALEDARGIRFPVEDLDMAHVIQARMHKARSLVRDRNVKIQRPEDPDYGQTDYDGLMVRIRRDGDQIYVYVEQRPALSIESLSDLEDEPVDAREPVPPTLDIRGFKRRL